MVKLEDIQKGQDIFLVRISGWGFGSQKAIVERYKVKSIGQVSIIAYHFIFGKYNENYNRLNDWENLFSNLSQALKHAIKENNLIIEDMQSHILKLTSANKGMTDMFYNLKKKGVMKNGRPKKKKL